jgi:TetR/AcrR family transcriptional regulator
MEAAGRLIIRRGSEHVTVKGIAGEVGFSEAAIYRHFKSKKDVLLFLTDCVRDRLLAEYVAGALDGEDSLGTLQAGLANHAAAIARRGGISFQIIAEIISLGDRELNARAFNALEQYVARLESLLDGAVKQGSLRPDLDTRAAAAAISAMMQGLVNTWVLSNYKFDLKAEFAGIWRTLLQGLCPCPLTQR